MKKTPKPRSAGQLLEFLNTEYANLHKKYEDAFWLSYMGDHDYDQVMNTAQAKRDAFRSNAEIRNEVRVMIKKAKSIQKQRLKIWDKFFGLYQTPPDALVIRKKIADLEVSINKIRTSRKEGYIDPTSSQFVAASENKMRTLMRTHSNEAVRQACFQSLEKLPLETLDLYIEVIGKRNEFAHILGYKDFYDYKVHIDENMTKKELFSIFEKIYTKTKYAFDNIRLLEKDKPGLRKPWNFAFMMTGSFTKEEDPYFQFENVISYWGRSMAALGIDFNCGKVTLDLLDRQGKYNNGFCHYPKLVRQEKGKWYKGSANFSSNAIPDQIGSGIQGIHTVFHEGGHATHLINSRQPLVCLNHEYPPSTVSWAETQSMFMDSISSSIEWKTRYAKNDKGESYPFALYEKRLRSVYPLRPLDLMGIMHVVFFEKEIYECKNLNREFVLETARKIARKYFDRSEDSIGVLNVPHIYSWESSAYYHGYGLAELAVSQWRTYFFKKYDYIVDNPKVGKELKKVWSYASLYPAKKLIKMATGRSLSPKDYINGITAPLDKILSRAKNKIERLKQVPILNKPVDLKGKIFIVHGKKKITDNSKSFENMEKKFRIWILSTKKPIV